MKRSMVLLFSCLALAGSAWLAHVVWAQSTETKEEDVHDHARAKLDKYVADKVAKAVAAERGKATHEKVVTDDEVLNPQNWHIAVVRPCPICNLHGTRHADVPSLGTATAKPPAAKSGAKGRHGDRTAFQRQLSSTSAA